MSQSTERVSDKAEAVLSQITELTARYEAEMNALCLQIGANDKIDHDQKRQLFQRLMGEYFPLFIELAKELGANAALAATEEFGITVPWYDQRGAIKVKPFERLNQRPAFMVMLAERALQAPDVEPTDLDMASTSARVGSLLTQ